MTGTSEAETSVSGKVECLLAIILFTIYHCKLSFTFYHCKTLGDRSFVAAAPALWNKLPRAVRHSQNVQTFKKALKTHLFRKAYNL